MCKTMNLLSSLNVGSVYVISITDYFVLEKKLEGSSLGETNSPLLLSSSLNNGKEIIPSIRNLTRYPGLVG